MKKTIALLSLFTAIFSTHAMANSALNTGIAEIDNLLATKRNPPCISLERLACMLAPRCYGKNNYPGRGFCAPRGF